MDRRTFCELATGAASSLLLNAFSRASAKGDSTHPIQDIALEIPGLMRRNNVPGLSLALFRQGEIVWARGFGVKDSSSGIPVTNTTVFEAASMSKPLFAYVVLKLSEKGVLDLDRPLTNYAKYPPFTEDPRLNLITARQILSHSSGLVPDWRSTQQPLRIASAPGEKWAYSGEGYYYLQTVVTDLTGHTDPNQCESYEAGLRVCGTDFGEYMESRLLVPFRMRSSGYVVRPRIIRERARPHDVEGNPLPYRNQRAVDIARYGAAGGLLTTPSDYANFMLQIMKTKLADEFHIGASTFKQMMTPQVTVTKEAGTLVSWSLGWRIARTSSRVYFGHGGENPGFQCISEACIADRSGFVAMTNGDNGAELLRTLAPELSTLLHS